MAEKKVKTKPAAAEQAAAGGTAEGDLGQRLEELERRLADEQGRREVAEAQTQEHLDHLKRLAADFENYRKRAARDQQSLVARAHEGLVRELLPVLDDLERALAAAAEHEEAAQPPVRESGPEEGVRGNRDVPSATAAGARSTKLLEGVQLVHRQLSSTLAREGLAEIETDGRFDPHVHEALLAQPSDREEGAVIDVLQKGYRLGDRVLRPARVVVAAPAAPAQSQDA